MPQDEFEEILADDTKEFSGELPRLDGFTEEQVMAGVEFARQRGWLKVMTTVTGQRVVQGLTSLGCKVANTNTVLSKMIRS